MSVLLTVCGCGGGDNNTPSAGAGERSSSASPNGAPSASSSPPITTSSSPAAASSPAGSSGDAALSARNLCGYLRADLPRLRAVGSSVGALAQLAMGLASWVDKHPDQKPESAATLDEVTARDCPDVRKQVLTVLKADRFAGTI